MRVTLVLTFLLHTIPARALHVYTIISRAIPVQTTLVLCILLHAILVRATLVFTFLVHATPMHTILLCATHVRNTLVRYSLTRYFYSRYSLERVILLCDIHVHATIVLAIPECERYSPGPSALFLPLTLLVLWVLRVRVRSLFLFTLLVCTILSCELLHHVIIPLALQSPIVFTILSITTSTPL